MVEWRNPATEGGENVGLFDGLFGANDLVIRDKATGESRTFRRTEAGYVAARDYQKTILERGHEVGDDRTGSLRDLNDLLGPVDTGRRG